MAFEVPFEIPPEDSIASFDFFDLASGSAYKTLYAADTTGGVEILTPVPIYSDSGSEGGNGQSSEFSIIFNLPLQMSGKCYLYIPAFYESPLGTQTITLGITPTIKKNGVIIVAGAQKSLARSTTLGTNLQSVFSWALTIPTTTLAKDDILSLLVEISVSQSNGTTLSGINFDPKDRNINVAASEFITSQLVMIVPFIPDI